jgi:HK97 family phage prohead protease
MKHKSPAPVSGKRELRTFAAASPLEVRTTSDGSKQIAGTAIVYNSRSVDLGSFTEIVSPGALTRTLRESPDILAFRDHDQTLLLGRTTAGTLKLTNTAKGLDFVLTLPKTAIGDDTAENVRLRNLTGVSFAFRVAPSGDKWEQDAQGNVTRTLLDIDLYEVSPTSFAAYPASNVSIRSAPEKIKEKLRRDIVDDIIADDSSDDVDNDNDDDPDEDDERCQCSCVPCHLEQDCSRCMDRDCQRDECSACPMQDTERAQRLDGLRLRSLIRHRKHANQSQSL